MGPRASQHSQERLHLSSFTGMKLQLLINMAPSTLMTGVKLDQRFLVEFDSFSCISSSWLYSSVAQNPEDEAFEMISQELRPLSLTNKHTLPTVDSYKYSGYLFSYRSKVYKPPITVCWLHDTWVHLTSYSSLRNESV